MKLFVDQITTIKLEKNETHNITPPLKSEETKSDILLESQMKEAESRLPLGETGGFRFQRALTTNLDDDYNSLLDISDGDCYD